MSERARRATETDRAIVFQRHGEPADLDAWREASLPLDEAIEQSLSHSAEIQVALASVRAALADARQARLLPNPVLSVAVRFPEGGGTASVEAGLTADLLSLLTRPRRINAADHRLAAASAEALTTVLDRLFEVQERYASVQSLDAERKVLDEQRRLIGRLLDLARSRLSAGESSRLDVLALQTEQVRVEAESLDAQARLRDERLSLARLIGQPAQSADWALEPWRAPAAMPTDEGSWIAAALEHRPEVQARRWELAALGDEAALSQWGAWTADAGVDAEREEDWSIGPSVSTPLPLLDWGQARREKADAERIAGRHRLVQARRQVIEDVRRAVASLSGAQRSLAKVQDELLPILVRRHEQARDAYNAGVSSITDVLLAEQELQRSRARLVELQRQVSSAQSRLHRAVGGPGIAADLPHETQRPNRQDSATRPLQSSHNTRKSS